MPDMIISNAPESDPVLASEAGISCLKCGDYFSLPAPGDAWTDFPHGGSRHTSGVVLTKEKSGYCHRCGPRIRFCHVCGCTNFTPCYTFHDTQTKLPTGTCYWAQLELCSACESVEVPA